MSTDTTTTDAPAPAGIPPWVLAPHVDTTGRPWAAQIRSRWDALSSREQRLVTDAAVMGYMLGAFSVPDRPPATIPRNRDIVDRVIAGCITLGEQFPTIHHAGSRSRARRR